VTTHLVQFSTGAGSAEVAWRVIEAHGAESTILLTADTLAEDEDNWRFAREVVDRLGCRWDVLADGRTPMQVGRDERVVPNDRMAVCSKILKRELLRKHIDATYDPADTVIYLGFDWTEPPSRTGSPIGLPHP
jgi:3'-phosphoadenosine 5'-phosphosulfate sulfotransferase (PAPS reductase)/FAD synthetase